MVENKIPNILTSELLTFILTTYNDGENMDGLYQDLIKSFSKKVLSFGLIGVDAGSSDNSVDILERLCPVLGPHNCDSQYVKLDRRPEEFKDLSKALNIGIDLAMLAGSQYICWIHPDMKFFNEGRGVGWIEAQMQYLKDNPKVGKVSPEVEPSPEFGERPGHQCPWVLTAEVIEKLKKQDGYVFDEGYQLCGGYEDWDLCKRILDLGYKVMIAGKPRISHVSMGTRKKYDNNAAARFNAGLYQHKWGQSAPFV